MSDKLSEKCYDLVLAHKFSSKHRNDLEKDSICGCFYCLEIFNPKEITEWTDYGTTAICPYCDMDSVVGESSGFPITKDFLSAMRRKWFEE